MKKTARIQSKCPICASSNIMELIDIPKVPVFCNVLWNTHQESLKVPRGDIRLGFCIKCSHIYNLSFEPHLVSYTQGYENSLHFSPRFQTYAQALADRLIQTYDLHNRTIIEIGAGQGDFLKMLCDQGDNQGLGFDPSHIPLDDLKGDPRITFIPDYYSEKYNQYMADFIVSRHVLEHIDTPTDFIASLRRTIGDRNKIVVFFEVPNALFTLQALGIWDLIFEHFSYFTPLSLCTLFQTNGFNILNNSAGFNGQFLTIETLPNGEGQTQPHPIAGKVETLARDAAAFKGSYQQKTAYWKRTLKNFTQQAKKVVVWGAGSKGVTFLNVLSSYHKIEYVVDINPRKRGKFVSGSGQEIVHPDFLSGYQPDIVIIMNANYQEEIEMDLDQLGVKAEILLA